MVFFCCAGVIAMVDFGGTGLRGSGYGQIEKGPSLVLRWSLLKKKLGNGLFHHYAVHFGLTISS